jgi:hypothetical protein
MNVVQVVFYVAALLLLLAAAFLLDHRRVAFGWLGLACWLIAAVFLPLLD